MKNLKRIYMEVDKHTTFESVCNHVLYMDKGVSLVHKRAGVPPTYDNINLM